MMHDARDRQKRKTERHAGKSGKLELFFFLFFFVFSVSADHIKTRFRVLALFIPFSSKLKMIPISHFASRESNPRLRLMGFCKEK